LVSLWERRENWSAVNLSGSANTSSIPIFYGIELKLYSVQSHYKDKHIPVSIYLF
jgi:hypothetical protein